MKHTIQLRTSSTKGGKNSGLLHDHIPNKVSMAAKNSAQNPVSVIRGVATGVVGVNGVKEVVVEPSPPTGNGIDAMEGRRRCRHKSAT